MLLRAILLGGLVLSVPMPGDCAPRKTPAFESSVEDLPVPPIPPDQPPPFRDAPVPNGDFLSDSPSTSQGPTLSPNFFKPRDYNIGQGYTPGSTVQSEQRRRAAPTPGFNLSVPLQ